MKNQLLERILLAVSAAICVSITFDPSVAGAQTGRERGLQMQRVEQTEQRVALVIGNSAYADAPLQNPVNDAHDMAQELRRFGFEVIYGENVAQNDMKRLIRAFGDKIRHGGVGLFYYAGHGVQVNGRNYLIPVRASITKEEEVEYESVDVGFLLAQMESAGNRLNIVILDACRNNPFARSFRSSKGGLASIDAPSGTLIAYATAPGSVASDGGGRNGLYTMELLGAMRSPGAKIEDIFKRVRLAVQTKTGRRQVPWESSSLVGDFYFSEKSGAVEESAERAPTPAVVALDRTDAQATARAILQAYKAKDLGALSQLSTLGNRAMISELAEQGERHPRYRSIFSGWRFQAAQAWNGQVDEVRYRQVRGELVNYLMARVKFGEIGPDELLVVTMHWENGQWCFEDIHSPGRADFESDSKVRPK